MFGANRANTFTFRASVSARANQIRTIVAGVAAVAEIRRTVYANTATLAVLAFLEVSSAAIGTNMITAFAAHTVFAAEVRITHLAIITALFTNYTGAFTDSFASAALVLRAVAVTAKLAFRTGFVLHAVVTLRQTV